MSASDTTAPLTARGTPPPAAAAPPLWTWAALAVAVAGLAGSLYLSLGMGLKACPLCFYQRTFMMSLVAVLGMGLLAGLVGRIANPSYPLALLALPLAVAGLGVALFHVSLELRGKLECPAGVLGLGTAPEQSLTVFLVLTVLLTTGLPWRAQAPAATCAALAGAVTLGALLAVASTLANPPSKPSTRRLTLAPRTSAGPPLPSP
jgi:disulfide bond formation protein DsbB